MIWSKAFVEERERYDGADIAHLLRACGKHFAWPRLLRRFDPHWRVLLSHLVLFGFIYPAKHDRIPEWVIQELLYRLSHELQTTPSHESLCQGTLLSRQQYLADTLQWGYQDARLLPKGALTQEEVDNWTAAIAKKSKRTTGFKRKRKDEKAKWGKEQLEGKHTKIWIQSKKPCCRHDAIKLSCSVIASVAQQSLFC